jgi:hypothetical protein
VDFAGYGSTAERSGREGLVKSKTVSDHDDTGVTGGSQVGDTGPRTASAFSYPQPGFSQIDLRSQGLISCSGRLRG